MWHQTEIRGNTELISFFGKCWDGQLRVFRVSIINGNYFEELCLNEYAKKQSNWEEDFDNLIPFLLEENQPAYLLFRFDSQNSLGYEWLFITWIPEHAPVREKMIYASTKATLKSQFGSGQIKEDILGTVPLRCISEAGLKAMIDFKHKTYSYVQLSIASTPLFSLVPDEHGRYHVFRFAHIHEGDFLESIVFICSMPGYACSIRERLLYSSCKGHIIDLIENKLLIQIDKKIEVEKGDELTEDFIRDELHPRKKLHQPKFENPKGPPGRGARRLTSQKPQDMCGLSQLQRQVPINKTYIENEMIEHTVDRAEHIHLMNRLLPITGRARCSPK
ncbi:hypothetical protein GHT06_009133 [Daphnia sinensis]|uniref:Twinfilin n=1 Tax=Daphnia sinensis TaxID=1820382 RepID=A0AAD5L2I9_9CRUS|nr:hypothetical protein GHT06_009133 [Daphnia sinensis]